MKSAMLLDSTLELIRRSELETEARDDLLLVVQALDLRYFALVADLLSARDIPEREALERARCVILLVATVQLADDLADDECAYLSDPHRRGPGLQALLHTLAFVCLLRTSLPRELVEQVMRDLLAVGGGQQQEISSVRWTLDRYLNVAQKSNGRQFAAYFRILLYDAVSPDDAAALGHAFGICVHVVSDAKDCDGRWLGMSEEDRLKTVAFVLAQARSALSFGVVALQRHLFYMLGYAAALSVMRCKSSCSASSEDLDRDR